MRHNPFTETTDQRIADMASDIRRTHDFLRVLMQVLKRNGSVSDADLADITTICPRVSAHVIANDHRRHG